MIDLHCHALPSVDDGPGTVGEAVELVRAAEAAGVTRLVATPHVSSRYPATGASEIARRVLHLNGVLESEGIAVRCLKGAEVAVDHAALLSDEELLRLRLGGGKWLLAECAVAAPPSIVEHGLRDLAGRGCRLLLAHPERIGAFANDPELLRSLVADGMLCQLTASSLTGRFGASVQRFARSLIEQGLVHVMASDAHSHRNRRPDALRHLQEAGFAPESEWISYWTQSVPESLLGDLPLPPPPDVAAQAGR